MLGSFWFGARRPRFEEVSRPFGPWRPVSGPGTDDDEDDDDDDDDDGGGDDDDGG